MNINENERVFELKPLGIKYICEFCGEGEMMVDTKEAIIVQLDGKASPMRTHICSKCGKTMQLPKTYPYIEWVTEDEYNEYLRGKSNDSAEVHVDN